MNLESKNMNAEMPLPTPKKWLVMPNEQIVISKLKREYELLVMEVREVLHEIDGAVKREDLRQVAMYADDLRGLVREVRS